MFVKTETITKKSIQSFQDQLGPDSALMSFQVKGKNYFQLVIGASYVNASACNFSKKGLSQLVDELIELRDALNEEEN